MKIEANLLTVVKGQMKEVEIFGEVYELIKKGQEVKQEHIEPHVEEKPTIETEEKYETIPTMYEPTSIVEIEQAKDRGPKLDNVYNSVIYKNIYEEIKPLVLSKKDDSKTLREIIREYYPVAKPSTWKCLPSTYRNYIKRKFDMKVGQGIKIQTIGDKTIVTGVTINNKLVGELLIGIKNNFSREYLEEVVRKYHPNVTRSTVHKYLSAHLRHIGETTEYDVSIFLARRGRKKRKKSGRGTKKPSSDSVGFSETYKTWIKADELAYVKRGIRTVKYGFVPTMENISLEISLPVQRVRACIDYLIQQGIAEKKYVDENYCYYLNE